MNKETHDFLVNQAMKHYEAYEALIKASKMFIEDAIEVTQKEKIKYTITFIDELCDCLGVTKSEILGKSRDQNTSAVRDLYCFIAKNHFGHTLMRIGNDINRNHASVLNSIRNVTDSLSGNKSTYPAKRLLIVKYYRLVETVFK